MRAVQVSVLLMPRERYLEWRLRKWGKCVRTACKDYLHVWQGKVYTQLLLVLHKHKATYRNMKYFHVKYFCVNFLCNFLSIILCKILCLNIFVGCGNPQKLNARNVIFCRQILVCLIFMFRLPTKIIYPQTFPKLWYSIPYCCQSLLLFLWLLLQPYQDLKVAENYKCWRPKCPQAGDD